MIWLFLRQSGQILAACEIWADVFALNFEIGRVSVRHGNQVYVGTRSERQDSDLRLALALGLLDPCSGRALGWEALA